MRGLNVPDAHIDLKRYETRRVWDGAMTEDAFKAFEFCVDLAIQQNVQLLTCAGDLFTGISLSDKAWERVIAAFERLRKANIGAVILGGNHDSVRTYYRRSSLDALGALSHVHVINGFQPEVFEFGDIKVGGIPHMKNAAKYINAAKNWEEQVDVLLLHCLIGDYSDGKKMGPNDMWLPPEMVQRLKAFSKLIFIGHEHRFNRFMPGVWQTGATMPMSFSELGEKYALVWDTNPNVNLYEVPEKLLPYGVASEVPIPSPRAFYDYEREWKGRDEFAKLLNERRTDSRCAFRFRIHGIPSEEFPLAKVMSEAVSAAADAAQILVFDLRKKDEQTLEDVTHEQAHFDLLTEFEEFCEKQKISKEERESMGQMLAEALLAIEAEEED